MTNAFAVVLDNEALRWAAAEGVPETVIAAVLLLEEWGIGGGIDEIVTKLRPSELEQVIKLVGRSPSCYPPGTFDALKGRRPAPSPQPVAGISAGRVGSGRPAARIEADAEHMRRAKEDRLARLHVRPLRSAPQPERTVTPAKTGTGRGMRAAETARRRMVVEDLRKAGLSVRMISSGTGIPVGSVHRAMRAIARAEAKKEAAVAEIAAQLLGKRLRRGGRGRP
jgi:hypothetical protein